MADDRKKLSSKFLPGSRFSNFGAVITEAEIKGFRGLASTRISFDYPVTALSGFNGAGKSTVGQLMLCGYRKLSTASLSKRFYVKDFFPVSAADPKPFVDDASVIFKYQTDKSDTFQEVTVARAQKEWSGYKRQPERNTEYVGFTVYIPKVERRDISIYNALNLTLTDRRDVDNASTYVSRILGSPYDSIYFQGVQASSKSSELGVAERFGARYSENNMGFGEGRVVYTVRLLETCAEQSLIVLEEPETSLHENAQYEFVKYLIDVCNRRHHQIIFSTHSSTMMDALPPEARKLLMRSAEGVTVFDSVSSSRIKTALSGGEDGHVTLCVEDKFAQSLLREVLRRFDVGLLSSTSIVFFGDAKAVKSARAALTSCGRKALAVLDADQNAVPKEDVFTLPGSLPPEKEIFCSLWAKNELKVKYAFDINTYFSSYPDADHHDYADYIALKTSCSREVLESDCIRAFLDGVGAEWSKDLCETLRARIAKM